MVANPCFRKGWNEQLLKEEIEKLGLGDHLCCMYKDDEERFSVVIPFLRKGLERNEKCVYIADETTKQKVFCAFKDSGLDIGRQTSSGQFEFLTKDDTYLREGYFDPDMMIKLLKESQDAAIKEGYNGLRVTGEMTWVFTNLPGVEKLIEYESELNRFFPGSKCTAICQYDEKKFDPRVLLDAINVHPKIILNGCIITNPFFIAPKDFLFMVKNRVSKSFYDRFKKSLIEKYKLEVERVKLETQLRKAENRYRCLFENAVDAIFVADAETGVLVDCNLAATKLVGRRKSEIVGKHQRILHPRQSVLKDGFSKTFKRHLVENGKILKGEVLTKSGETRDVLIKANLIEIEGKEYLQGIFRDITELEKADRALAASEDKFRDLAGSITDVFFAMDRSLKYIYWNKATEKLTGISAKDAIGKSISEVFPASEQLGKDIRRYNEVLKTGKPQIFESVYRRGNAEIFFEFFVYPAKDGLSVIARDITELKKLRDKLSENEVNYWRLVENMSEGLGVTDENGVITYVNWSYCKMFGYSKEELIGRNLMDILPKNLHESIKDEMNRLKNGERLYSEHEEITKDGKKILVSVSSVPIFSPDGNFQGRFALISDITERKKTEIQLKEREAVLNSLFESADDAIYMVDEKLKYLSANSALGSRLHTPVKDIINKHFGDFHTPEETNQFFEAVNEVIRTGETKQQEFWSGREHKVYLRTLSPVKDHAGKIMAVTVISKDITELKATQEILMLTEQKLRKIIDACSDIVIVTDLDGNITECNQAVLDDCGFSTKEEVIGNLFSNFFVSEERQHLMENFKNLTEVTSLKNMEATLLAKDGRRIPVEISGKAVFGPVGKPIFYVFLIKDITARKNLEKSLRESIYTVNSISLGECYLSAQRTTAYKLFSQLVIHGVPGLCISREKPDLLTSYGIPREKIAILSSVPVKEFETIDDLQKVSMKISDFLRENKESVILLDGIEYLISRSGFEAVYKFLQEKRFNFVEHAANLLVPIDLNTLTEKERALMLRELKPISK